MTDISIAVLTRDEKKFLRRISRDLPVDIGSITAQRLRHNGFIEFEYIGIKNGVSQFSDKLLLTEDGERYFAYRHEERCRFWAHSIFAPILVALATSILINLLFLLWQPMKEWFLQLL